MGQDHVRRHTQTDADELHQNNFVVVLKAGGGVDQYQTESAGQKTQGQQEYIALAEKLPDGGKQGDQGVTSLQVESNIIFYHNFVETQTQGVV